MVCFDEEKSSLDKTINYWVVDRILENQANVVNDDGEQLIVDLLDLPAYSQEGDCLRLEDHNWTVDAEETTRRKLLQRQRLRKLFDRKREII